MEDKFLPLKRSKLLMDGDGEVVRLRTEKPPAHCILKVDSFSEVQDALCASSKDHLKSTEFSAGGYTWVLSVYPKGNKQEQVDDHLSVYVTLIDKLTPGSFVDVVLRFFLYDHLRDAYLSVLDVRERRFHVLKDTWGVPKFLSVSTFNDADYGFLVDDCCVFGAEVLVINSHFKISTMSIVQENCDRSYTWRIENFSTLNDVVCSPVYCFDGWSWKLVLCARGSNKKGKSLSLYLQLDDTSRLTQGNKLYVADFFCLKNQRQGKDHKESEVARIMTQKPPAHCILKIDSFSVLQDASNFISNKDNFKSTEFKVGGYTWVFSVCPKGNNQEQGDDHLSVYVTLVDKLNSGSFVDVVLRFFLCDQLRDAYLSVLDVKERRFHALKYTWGVTKFLPISTFNDTNYGFLVDDCCIFGAEVFVINNQVKISTLLVVEEKHDRSFTWRVENFSSLNDELHSPVFCYNGWTWVLSVFPKGNKQEHVDDHLSVYVTLVDKLAPGSFVDAVLRFYLYDQLRDAYLSVLDAREKRFHYLKNTWGVSKFLPISTFNDPENGFLVDDYCVFGAEVFVLKNQAKISTMSIPEEDCVRSYTWRIKNFTLTTAPTNLYSPGFWLNGRSWRLDLYPKGIRNMNGGYLSLYLQLDSSSGLNYGNKLYVEYFLKLKNQREGENHQKLCYQWFSASENRCGSSAFLSINDLLYSSKGYLVSNTLIVEVCVEKMFLLKD